ncbi:MAG: glycoside hydrolase TIM-barrel-like domain-containing protein [Pseudomonadota bacterium]
MATVLLAAAGSSVGGAIGGTVLGLGAGTIGQAVGAVGGSFIDQSILGRGSRTVETGRARSLRIQTSTEGSPMPISFGRMRVAGSVIWSTRFLETVREENVGGKATGGQRVRLYRYSISLAVAIGEGPIDRVGRIWADGEEMDLAGVTYRVYKGDETQLPDPKIEAVEGADNAPAYRGTAYVVFEDLQLDPYGNRIPQLNFEVFRGAWSEELGLDPEIHGLPLPQIVEAVALSPGTGEHALHTEPQRYLYDGDATQAANVHNTTLEPDITVALDQLEADLPECKSVSLIVSWFGDDLRVGRCTVRPKVEVEDRASGPASWRVSGLTTSSAALISVNGEGRPNYGGTPSDASVIAAIQELKARGHRVMIYPFLLMDVPPNNTLTDPYTGAIGQPVFPWRGRITLDAAPGQPGSTDQTADAALEVDAFFGTAEASDFSVAATTANYSGPSEWSWRRFVLHLAALAQAAGGVDAFCIGSELRGITWIRSATTTYPAIDHLRDLAGEVRILLPSTQISYAADWSEYFGHHPNDGSGDVIFNLDPLWADANIDFIGIDDYMSAADWRYAGSHTDLLDGARSTYELPYLRSNIAGGENYDWYYADDVARAAQDRTPIVDTGHGEDWVFRPKDLVNWWSNPHHNRIGGVRQSTSTVWQPSSKPIWLTETGCPAVDLGANRPNLFIDPKSSESGAPSGSRGVRDDEIQRRFLQAKIGFWADPVNNPISGVYGGPMLPVDRIYLWTWDARPWPDFPLRDDIWADGPNHRLGHWITGRASASGLAEVVAAICHRAGLTAFDVDDLHGVVHGFLIEQNRSAREALQPLMTTYGFDGFESRGKVVFRMRGGPVDATLLSDFLVAGDEPGQAVETARASAGDLADVVRLAFVQSEGAYLQGAAETIRPGTAGLLVDETSVPIAFPSATATGIVERWLAEQSRGRETQDFALPPSRLAVEPGDVVTLDGEVGAWRVDRVDWGLTGETETMRVDAALHFPGGGVERAVATVPAVLPGPIRAEFLDLPLAAGDADDHRPRLALSANPWPGSVDVHAVADESFLGLGTQRVPALSGSLTTALPAGEADLWQRTSVEVLMTGEGLSSVSDSALLNGANKAALVRADGTVEVIQFRDADLVGERRYLVGHFLRGQRGTEDLAAQDAPVGTRFVLIDDGVFTLPITLDDLGRSLVLRAGPSDRAPDDASHVEFSATPLGAGLRTFAPAHLSVKETVSGDLVFSWIRRTRIGGDSWFGAEVPLGEESEAYSLRIRKNGVTLREETLTSPGFTYTAAARSADGATGAIEADVAQISTVYGAGTRRSLMIDG